MSRLRPRLFTVVSLLSLCLCTVSIYLWRKSFTNPTAAVPTTTDMRRILIGPAPAFNLNTASLEAYAEDLANHTRLVKYEIDWPALEAVKVTKSMPMGANLRSKRLGDLLAELTASMGPQVRFTTHDYVIRISTINTPRSAGGVQYVQQAGGSNYFGAVTPATGAARPPQPTIKPLYERTIGTRRLTVGAYHGYLGLCLSPNDPADAYYKPRPPAPRAMPGVNFSHTAFYYQHHPWFDIRVLVLPFWWLVVGTAFFPLLWAVLFLGQLRRKQQHRCANCGYDLRATPTQCPECGHIPQHP